MFPHFLNNDKEKDKDKETEEEKSEEKSLEEILMRKGLLFPLKIINF